MKFKPFLCTLVTLTFLTGCQTFQNLTDDLSDATNNLSSLPTTTPTSPERLLESPCPQVELVDDLSSISDFVNMQKISHENLVSRVDLGSAESTCKLSNNSAIVDLKLIFNGILGAKGRMKNSDTPYFSYPYFVAVTAPNGKIMAKEIFAAPISYNANENEHVYFENLRQIIPIRSKDVANHYKILIGFQVSPEQLAYNRANMVPVAKIDAVEHPDNL